MRRGIPILTACIVGPIFGVATLGAPQTSVISRSWQLEFEFHDPQRIEVDLPGADQPAFFWYVLYTVTNSTRSEVDFFPSFRLISGELEVVSAGESVLPQVVDEIASRHKAEYPFLISPTSVGGRLLQGRENARNSVAVFRPFNVDASGFTLFVAGLSGEMERIANPSFDGTLKESEGNPSSFLFRRTLAVTYDLPGDSITRHNAAPRRRSREWVMR